MISLSAGIASLQGLIMLALGLVSLGITAFALFDVLRQSADAFPAAGKQTKQLWLIFLVLATALAFVSIFRPLNFFNLIAVVAAGVYLADVRPAVRVYRGRRGGGSSSSGPYGPW
jgi:hypothetical protein